MDISVILATYKRPNILKQTLQSFINLEIAHLRWELFVVDNAGDLETKDVVELFYGKLPINYLVETVPGKNNALNRAIGEVNGELIIFTDDDIITTESWLIQMWEGGVRWPSNVIFGGRVLPSWPKGFEGHDLSNPHLTSAYAIADWDLLEGPYTYDKVFGANMAVRMKIFNEGWRFDGNIGPNNKLDYIMGSESEFLFRLANAGFPPVYLPGSLVYHQIRPEQMALQWLKKRAYKSGKSSVPLHKNSHNFPTLIRVPRYLFRMIIESYFLLILSILFSSKRKIEYIMRVNHLWGQICQYRKL